MNINLEPEVRRRMAYLEEIDSEDRKDGTPFNKRLRQIPREAGRFLALLASIAPPGQYVEIGTSGGYSTLWIATVCRQLGRNLVTFEVLPGKVELATETLRVAELADIVSSIHGRFEEFADSFDHISFCFLDAVSDAYLDTYETIVPKMVQGGLLIADNAISHRDELVEFLERVNVDHRVESLTVPIGDGELVCRRVSRTY